MCNNSERIYRAVEKLIKFICFYTEFGQKFSEYFERNFFNLITTLSISFLYLMY